MNETLPFQNDPVDSNKLYYSDGRDQNYVGPLLEKALIELLFNGNYELAHGDGTMNVLNSFTNSYFEEFYGPGLIDLGYNVKDVIIHGKKSNSLMVITFKTTVSEYNILDCHVYSLIDLTEDGVKLYNPHGKHLMIPTNIFVENFHRLHICYIDNEIFNFPKLKTSVEFTDSWKEITDDAQFSDVDYEFVVDEDDTEILINMFTNSYDEIFKSIRIYRVNEMNTLEPASIIYTVRSFRILLGRGKYKLTFKQRVASYNISSRHQKYSEYLENDKNDFLFRFVASKRCAVKKSD